MGVPGVWGDSGRMGVARDHQDKAPDKSLHGCRAKVSRAGVKVA